MKYSKELKAEVLSRYNSGERLIDIARALNLHAYTVFYFVKYAKADLNAHARQKEINVAFSTNAFYKVAESASMNTQERKDYCLKKNIDPNDLEKWRANCMSANEIDNSARLKQEIEELKAKLKEAEKQDKKIKALEREIKDYKEAAAGMSVLFSSLKNACRAQGIDVDVDVASKED